MVYDIIIYFTGSDFSHDGEFLALAERRDCKDYISVFACDTWQLVKVSKQKSYNISNFVEYLC